MPSYLAKPAFGPLNRSDPLGAKLTHAWFGHEGEKARFLINKVDGRRSSFGTGSGSTTGNYWTTTRFGKSLLLDTTGTGTAESVIIVPGVSGCPRSQRFSLFARLSFGSVGGNQVVYHNDSTGGISWRLNTSNVMQLLKGGVASIGTSSTALSANTFYSVGVTYDGSTARFYLNGRPDGSATSAQTFSYTTTTLFSRGIGSGEVMPTGSIIDCIMVFDGVLGPSLQSALALDPFRMFRRERVPVPLYVASGGGPTYTLTCATGNFTLTGNATTLQVARKLPTTVGSFTLTGNATNLVATRKLPTTVGNFTLTGNNTSLQVARKLATQVANYTLTGNAINLVYTPTGGPTYTLTCSTGSFSLTGMNVGFIASRKLAAQTASYTLTGNAAGLAVGRKLATQAGSFTITGNTTTLQVARKLVTQAASFVLTGIAVALTYSGAPTFVNKILTTSTIGRIVRTTSNIARKVRT